MGQRDEFSPDVKRRLKDRAGNQCSKPSCRAVTTAAAEGLDKVNNIGVAAHICAAAPGGPRFNPDMSPEQRRSIENGIWLCRKCATEIDNDEDRFPVSLLEQWKANAEEARKNELGKPLPRPDDAINTVAAALTGTAREFIPSAISNTHKATEQVFSELDPRFKVNTSYRNGVTTFEYLAKQDVSIKMSIEVERVGDFAEKYTRLISHGDDLSIDASAIRFAGSDAFEAIASQCEKGKLTFRGNRKEAVSRLRLVNALTGLEESLPDAVGVVRHGTDALTFEGSLFGGTIELSYTAGWRGELGTFLIKPWLTNPWRGREVNHLPYLDYLQALFEKLENGWLLAGSLEIEGLSVFTFDLKEYAPGEDGISDYFSYLQAAACIANYLSVPLKYDRDYLPTIDEFEEVVEAAKIIRKELVYSKEDIKGPIVNNMALDDEGARFIQSINEPGNVRIVEEETKTLIIMGVAIEMPPRVVYINEVLPRISGSHEGERSDKALPVELVPVDGFNVHVEYLQHGKGESE